MIYFLMRILLNLESNTRKRSCFMFSFCSANTIYNMLVEIPEFSPWFLQIVDYCGRIFFQIYIFIGKSFILIVWLDDIFQKKLFRKNKCCFFVFFRKLYFKGKMIYKPINFSLNKKIPYFHSKKTWKNIFFCWINMVEKFFWWRIKVCAGTNRIIRKLVNTWIRPLYQINHFLDKWIMFTLKTKTTSSSFLFSKSSRWSKLSTKYSFSSSIKIICSSVWWKFSISKFVNSFRSGFSTQIYLSYIPKVSYISSFFRASFFPGLCKLMG